MSESDDLNLEPEAKELLRGQLYEMLGGHGDVTGDGTLREQLLAIAGPSKTSKSGVAVSAAAKALGRHPSTIQRWLNDGQPPTKKNARAVRAVARRVGRTKAGRGRAVEAGRSENRYAGKQGLAITAMQGPADTGSDVARERTIYFDLSQDQIDELADLYAEKGETEAMTWINGRLGEIYMQNKGAWEIEDWNVDGAGITFHEGKRIARKGRR